ncbi:hypothetical protein PFUGPA_00525 [Plasmodium falciparum Palo Alto/Uganda]|uniref:Uncharacterized protein n=2 Tax=Plasmodium falciparum TaxID=5833 RepID=W4J764_PLAFP|nr:hypothetical protein PFUGPA_00525 [Plasmodium falciparum Palo Alto/Uganda]ETW63338.1 hypothetical protein PFMC_00814 [Plasmodium falciparum CAMP/Malaysia]
MEAPLFKPIHDVIRIKKKEHDVNIKSDIYKKFLELKKEAYINLENKNIKVIIYENMNYDDIKKKEKEHENYNSKSSNSSFCDEKCNEDINKNIKRDNVLKKNIKDDNYNDDENNKNNIQNDEKEYIDDVVKEEKKNTKVLGTLKILYNFYVNLFDKLKEDVENIQNNTNHNNIDLFRDINLYTNYISMFDILNLCEDLHIIKNFINSKKECELIWILTLNYFDNIKENVFQRYRHKINVTYKGRSTLEGQDEKGLQEDTTKNIEKKDIKQMKQMKQIEHEDNNDNDDDNNDDDNKNNHNNNNKNNHNNIKDKKKDTHNGKIKEKSDNSYVQKNNNNSYYNYNYNYSYSQDIHNQDTYYTDENHNIKEYIYDHLHDKENCIMYRKVNFFIFVYILIYIIKTSTRKIQAIKDDIKKVKSFFFFLNLYEKKKTMEILQNIYKDKYLQFFQNYRGKEEIEEYRKRKIFRHKFSFYNINKILYDKDDLIKLKNKNIQRDKEDKKKGNRKIVKNENYHIVKGMKNEPQEVKEKEKEKEPILNIHNKIDDEEGKEKREDVNKYELTNYIETIDMKEENIKGKFVQEENKKDTIIKDPKKNNENNNENNENNKNSNSSCCGSSSSDDHGNHNKNNVLLNQYIFDYIFKNYCYKKKYWKVRDGICVDYGIIKKEKKKFKIDIYNHSKYNINVDIDIDKELPLLVIFKDKLFCINSKYSIYLQVDNNENVGEKLGCIHVKCKYKNVHKQETFFKIPVYICLE